MGPLAELLRHYETECNFHASPCQRCGEHVPIAQLAAHYTVGCCSDTRLATGGREGACAACDGIAASAREQEVPSKYRYNDDDIPALQSQVNELTDASGIQGVQLRELNTAFAASLEIMNDKIVPAAEKLSQTISEASQQIQQLLLTRQTLDTSLVEDYEGSTGAGVSGEQMPWQEQKRTCLGNLGQVSLTLDRVLQSQRRLLFVREEICLVPRQHEEWFERTGHSGSSISANSNELIYYVVVMMPEQCPRGLFSRSALAYLPRSNSWFSATVSAIDGSVSVEFISRGEEKNDTYLEVVRATIVTGWSRIDLEQQHQRARTWRQHYTVFTSWTSSHFIGRHLLLEIVIKF